MTYIPKMNGENSVKKNYTEAVEWLIAKPHHQFFVKKMGFSIFNTWFMPLKLVLNFKPSNLNITLHVEAGPELVLFKFLGTIEVGDSTPNNRSG